MIRLKYILLFCCFAIGLQSFSQTRKELENQRKELQKEVRQIRSLLSENKSEEKNLLSQLNETSVQIITQGKLIKALDAEAKALSKDIKSNQKSIKTLENELKDLKEDYAKMIYKSYKSKSQQSRIMFLLSSDNFYQAYKRVQYMNQYTDFRKAQGVQITRKSDDLVVLNDTLKVRKTLQEKLVKENKGEEKKLEEEKKNQEKLVDEIKKQEKKYLAEIKKKQEEESKINKQIQKIIRDAIAKANAKTGTKSSEFVLTPEEKLVSRNFEGNKGKLIWPVERGYVSTRFGKQRHPVFKNNTINSSGVRITTEKGSNARAVFEGTVMSIQVSSGNRKSVYVRHGNYVTMYGNLETVFVQRGDKIEIKQELGIVFTDRITKKTILKFVVMKNTTFQNPASWIFKM